VKNISINIIGFSTESYPSGTTPSEVLESLKGVPKNTIIW
jgi:hypothetical protein